MTAVVLEMGHQNAARIYARVDYVDAVPTGRRSVVRFHPQGELSVWGLVESGQVVLAPRSLLADRTFFERYDGDYGMFKLGDQFAVLQSEDVREIGATKPDGTKFYHRWTHPVRMYRLPKVRAYVLVSSRGLNLWGTFPENVRELKRLNEVVFGTRR